MAVEQKDVGPRNSPYRGLGEALLDPPARAIYHFSPNLEAKDITDVGAKLIKGGIGLQEYLNRHQISSRPLTMISLGMVLTGLSCDLLDGKFARLKRSKMTDEVKKLEDEKEGQAYDPKIDGRIEADQSRQAADTALLLDRKWGVWTAAFSLGTGNLARTAKSVAGMFGVSVPETYKPWDLLHFPGISLGRKWLYFATYCPRLPLTPNIALPVQEVIHLWVGISNLVVTAERLNAILYPDTKPRLSENEVEFAEVRAWHLGRLSVTNIGMAVDLVRSLNCKNSKP